MIGSRFLDSSVWIEYYINGKLKDIVESEETIFISIISIFEIKKKLLNKKFDTKDVNRAMDFVQRRSLIVPLTKDIVNKAVEISIKNSLATVDSLIYTSSLLQNAQFYTLDNDFRGLEGTKVFD